MLKVRSPQDEPRDRAAEWTDLGEIKTRENSGPHPRVQAPALRLAALDRWPFIRRSAWVHEAQHIIL